MSKYRSKIIVLNFDEIDSRYYTRYLSSRTALNKIVIHVINIKFENEESGPVINELFIIDYRGKPIIMVQIWLDSAKEYKLVF